jgi:hypothetical protein
MTGQTSVTDLSVIKPKLMIAVDFNLVWLRKKAEGKDYII